MKKHNAKFSLLEYNANLYFDLHIFCIWIFFVLNCKVHASTRIN